MEQWQQFFYEFVNGVTHEVEQFVETVVGTVDVLADIAEETVVEVQKIAVAELERTFPFLRDDTFWAEFWDFEESDEFHHSISTIYGVEPMPATPPACQGCIHFHGQVYNGTPLVCGMYPHGPQSQNCIDWSAS